MNKRNLIAAVILLAGLTVLLIFVRGRQDPPNEEPEHADPNVVEIDVEAQRNSQIDVAEAEERLLAEEIELTGVVAPDEARVAHILPLAQGIVERIHVKLGDRVNRGQALLEFDNVELGELAAEYLRGAAQLNRAKAKLGVARRSLERAEQQLKVEGISQREYDERKAVYEEAEAEIAAQRAELLQVGQKLHRFGLTDEAIDRLGEQANGSARSLSHNVVRAPFAGVITRFSVAPGELISREKEIFTIVDTSSVWVVADVYQKDVARIAERGPCEVRISAYPEDTFKGTVANVSQFLDPQSRTAKLRCVIQNNDGRLKLDMFATVIVSSARSRTVLVVPSAAIQQVEADKVVFVQRNATHFERRRVETGVTTGQWVEIKSGLQRSEKVVSRGGFYVKSVLLKKELSGEE